MHRFWKDVEGKIPAEVGDPVARVDFVRVDVDDSGRLLLPDLPKFQPVPPHSPVLREIQRDE